jgi:hypothetical protein
MQLLLRPDQREWLQAQPRPMGETISQLIDDARKKRPLG